MPKVKCKAHNRRVFVSGIPGDALVTHREDLSRCVVNPSVHINGTTYSASEFVKNGQGARVRKGSQSVSSHESHRAEVWINEKGSV